MDWEVRMGSRPLIREPLYVCVRVPEFPAQARARLRPEITKAPLVILYGDPPLQQVCSLNRAALHLGVMHGMTRVELETFPGLHRLPPSTEEESASRTALLELAGAFTPRVQVIPDQTSAFVLGLDMTGTQRMFGDPLMLASRIASSIESLGLIARIATSRNLNAGVCMSKFARRKPVVIVHGDEAATLSPLPLSALQMSEQHASTFDVWGIRTLGELAALSETDLISRLGQEGKRLRALARGEHPHLFVPQEPVLSLSEHVAFDSPIDILDSLLFVLSTMLDHILIRARAYAFALSSVTVNLTLDGDGKHARTIKPALPIAERDILLKLMHLDLQANPPANGILSVSMTAQPGPRSKVQLGLFSPQSPEPMRLDVTLARIAALVGENRVGRAKLSDTHCSESFVIERFTVPETKASGQPPTIRLATRRLRPPIGIHAHCPAGVIASFVLEGQRYSVQQACGPWRKSGDWWSADVWSREEWDVRASSPSGEWIGILSCDLLRKQWQLEAWYD